VPGFGRGRSLTRLPAYPSGSDSTGSLGLISLENNRHNNQAANTTIANSKTTLKITRPQEPRLIIRMGRMVRPHKIPRTHRKDWWPTHEPHRWLIAIGRVAHASNPTNTSGAPFMQSHRMIGTFARKREPHLGKPSLQAWPSKARRKAPYHSAEGRSEARRAQRLIYSNPQPAQNQKVR
jgi:hypothetical protein